MQDRQPGAPGQYKATLTPAEFQKMQAGEQFSITMVRDDQPIVEGTPYSKAAVLPDDLAEVICPDVLNPTPADALAALMPRNGKSPMTGEINMAGHRVENVGEPEADGDAVNRGYANRTYQPKLGYIPVQQGFDDGTGSNKMRFAWRSVNGRNALGCTIDGTDVGNFVTDHPQYGGITPIEGGGTNANTAPEALRNLGTIGAKATWLDGYYSIDNILRNHMTDLSLFTGFSWTPLVDFPTQELGRWNICIYKTSNDFVEITATYSDIDNKYVRMWVAKFASESDMGLQWSQISARKLLWENASPWSGFAAQAISVPGLSFYPNYAVEMRTICDVDMCLTIVSTAGHGAMLIGNIGNLACSRDVSWEEDQLNFADCYGASNSYLVPVRIYGW